MQNQNTITQEETIEKKLLNAIQEKNIHKILKINPSKELLEKAYDPNTERGWSFLHHAAHCSNAEVIKCLIFKYGANVDIQDKKGRTPFHVATAHQCWNNMLCLKDCGANVNSTDKENNTALSATCANFAPDRLTIECLIIGCDADPMHSSVPNHAKQQLINLQKITPSKIAKIELLEKITLADLALTEKYLILTKNTWNATQYSPNAFGSPTHTAPRPSTISNPEEKVELSATLHTPSA